MTTLQKTLAAFDKRFVVTKGVLEKKCLGTNANDVTIKDFIKQAIKDAVEEERKRLKAEKNYIGKKLICKYCGKQFELEKPCQVYCNYCRFKVSEGYKRKKLRELNNIGGYQTVTKTKINYNIKNSGNWGTKLP